MKNKVAKNRKEKHSLAWDVCSELSKEKVHWRFAFFTSLGIELLTIAGFLLYLKKV